MDLATKQQDDITILSISGKITVDGAIEIEDFFKKSLEDGVKKLVVDISDVDLLSSSGLRSFIFGTKEAKAVKAKIVFCNVSSAITAAMQVVKLEDLFDIYDSTEKAIEAVS